jgi:hypothetical protein
MLGGADFGAKDLRGSAPSQSEVDPIGGIWLQLTTIKPDASNRIAPGRTGRETEPRRTAIAIILLEMR